jgi:pimeloyl-ACP methyl ester carboxylesterase
VAVPLDHDQPDGPTIDLALARRPATGERRGSIFVNPGGPGASGVEFVQSFSLDTETSAAYDLVGFDPRGVGASTAIGCDNERDVGPLPDFSPDDEAERRALDDDAMSFARDCQASDQTLLPHVTTDQVARDLDLLRQAVGDGELHYLGFSFGTLIGLVYAETFPDRVGHLVLDGVVDPTHDLVDLLTQQALAFEEAFAVLDAACDRRLSCPPGGAAAAHDELLARLERDGPVGEVGTAELEVAGLLALYEDDLWPTYVAGLGEALAGSYGTIEVLSDALTTAVRFGPYAAVECVDGPRPVGAEAWDQFVADVTAVAPRFGPAVANELRTCAYWPVVPGPARGPITAPGAAPVLVIGNTNDPATPLANAEAVAAQLDQAALVVAELDGHTAYSASPCVQALVRAYLLDDVLPAEGTRC